MISLKEKTELEHDILKDLVLLTTVEKVLWKSILSKKMVMIDANTCIQEQTEKFVMKQGNLHFQLTVSEDSYVEVYAEDGNPLCVLRSRNMATLRVNYVKPVSQPAGPTKRFFQVNDLVCAVLDQGVAVVSEEEEKNRLSVITSLSAVE